jgi:hypothetical protein
MPVVALLLDSDGAKIIDNRLKHSFFFMIVTAGNPSTTCQNWTTKKTGFFLTPKARPSTITHRGG